MGQRAGYLALVLFGLLAFLNAIRHPFVLDDAVFILNNPHITELNHWIDVFRVPTAGGAGGLNAYYRPVLEIIYRLEYFLMGPHPYGYHLFNILVHIINGLLLFCLLQRIGLRVAIAWTVSLFFLIHPLQTEAVSYISGISDIWMALGIFLALHFYLNRWYVLSLLCLVMAFLSKEQAIMFLPLVMVIDHVRGERKISRWLLWSFSIAVLLWLRQAVTGGALLNEIAAAKGELFLRLAAIPRDLGMYIRLIFFPHDLHLYRMTDILQPNGISWMLFLISLGDIVYILYRWPLVRPVLILGLGWFGAALLPVLNFVPLINEYSYIFTPEHFLYLPIIGILIVAVTAADHFVKQHRKLLLSVVACFCLLLTWHQNTFWKSEIALFERMLRYEPDFGRGHLLLAKAYYFNDRPKDADGHFGRALTIMSSYAKKAGNQTAKRFYLVYMKEILFDWSQNDSLMGHWPQALDKLKHEAALGGGDAPLYNNMAFIYLHLGDKNDARLSLEQALRIDPSFIQARDNLQALGRF